MMKVFLLSVLFLFTSFVSAQFDDGVNAYNKKNTKQARNFFLKALENEKTAALYFNVGLTYYQEKKYIAALAHFEHALKIDPHFEAAMINAGLTQDKIEAESIWTHPYSWLQRFIYSMPSQSWIISIYCFSFLLALGMFLWIRTKKNKNIFFLISFIGLIAFGSSIYGLHEQEKHLEQKEYCFAKNEHTTLFLSPNGWEQNEKLELGKRYKILKESTDFYQIKTQDNRLFWVNAEEVFSY